MATTQDLGMRRGREPASSRPPPAISLPFSTAEIRLRLPGVDLPQAHFPKSLPASACDVPLARLARWISRSPDLLEDQLAAHLVPRLATGRAGSLQERHGLAAARCLHRLLEPYRSAADDSAPETLAALPPEERATLAVLMAEAGWAVPFLLYPHPRKEDLQPLLQAARDARQNRRGAWADPGTLTGYEFRMCIRLYEMARRLRQGESPALGRPWILRYCVDFTTGEIFRPQQYCLVPPEHRLFILPQDVLEAIESLHLVGG